MTEEGSYSQKDYYYKKYKSSNIFNTDSNLNENIPLITPKPTEREYNKKFEPNYKIYSPYEMYLNQFCELDEKKIKKLYDEKKHKEFIKDMEKKSKNFKIKRNYSATGRYFNEFFGDKYYNNNKNKYKKNKINRINSFYETRSINIKKDNNNNIKNITSRSFSQQKKFQSNLSNIFFEKPKNFKFQRKENLTLNNSRENIERPKNKNIKKSLLPYKYDWTVLNTEIATKKYIENTRNIKDKKIYKSKPKNFLKIISDNNITPYKEKTENSKKIFPDKDHYKYEIIGKKELFNKLEPIIIKKMFLKEGIHIYNIDNNITNNDLIVQGKVTFNLRKDKNDINFNKKFNYICNEINSYGVKINEVIVNNNLYKKIRKATPGKNLKKK